ncbi:MAG TPA: HEAT repeat domain-containing protein [Tepidisphaeraceae bacterium]|jgi:hypothetical protein
MSELPFPSEVKKAETGAEANAAGAVIEPPNFKLLGRLFLVPLIIVTAAVGIMFLIGRLAGSTPSFDEALTRLKAPGGQKTMDLLVGPGSKQRYMDAKTLVDEMKSGLTLEQRAKISRELVNIITNHTRDTEGDVRHFLLLALGRVWQLDPAQPATADTLDASTARQQALATLMNFAQSMEISNRKAAILALAYWSGRSETGQALPLLLEKLQDGHEDIDVRLSAATVLGPIAQPTDAHVIAALHKVMDDADSAHRELVWASALSLAQLNQADVAPTILMLLDRKELAQLEILDREADPSNPTYRKLNELEQQRYLINTMIGASKLNAPEIRQRLADLRDHDPSPRVRNAAREVLR